MKEIDNRLFLNSSVREEYLEYVFAAGLSQCAWRRRAELEILRCQTESQGYDLILEASGRQRHVQLKSSYLGAQTRDQKISLNLAAKPSGCVIWMMFDPDTLEQVQFRFFGGKPGEPLPDPGDRIARHTKANSEGVKAERANLRIVSKEKFKMLETYDEVFEHLFTV